MSEERPQGTAGISSKGDIEPHPAYKETIPTKKPKAKVERHVNRSREVPIGSKR